VSRVDEWWNRLGFGVAARQVTNLSLGAAASQALLVVAQIVLGALYTPAEFGAFYTATALGGLLAIVVTGRYEMAIPLADTDDDARGLTALCLLLASAGSTALLAVAAIATVVAGDTVRHLVGPGLWLVPLVTFGMAIYTVQRLTQGRYERFGLVARAGVGGTLLQVLTQIGGGLLGGSSSALTIGYVLGRLGSAAGMMHGSRRSEGARPTLRRMRELARTWREFPLLNTWPALLNGISASGVAPVVRAFYGVSFAGLFGYASYILAAPSALLSQAVAGVLLPRMAGIEREGRDSAPSLHRTATALTYVSTVFFGAVMLVGPEAFALLPPAGRWRDAGVVAALLAPWLAVSFVSSPLSTYATVRRRLGRLLVVSVVEAGLRLAALAVGLLAGGALWGVACYSAAGVAICLYFISWTLGLAGSGLLRWAAQIRGFLAASAALLAVGLVARFTDTAPLAVGLVCAIGLAALGARGFLRLRHRGTG